MKRTILLVLLAMMLTLLAGEFQNLNTARQVMENFINYSAKEYASLNSYPISDERGTVAYIFNLKPDGFVAVSADNDFYPVIAYSFKNQLFEKDKDENILYQMIKDDLNLRMEYYQIDNREVQENHQIWNEFLNGKRRDRDFQQWPPEGTTQTDGWIEKRWNQSGVYQAFCPLDNNNHRSVVGCVATAMSMILDYHEYIGDVSFNNNDDYYSGYEWPYIYIDNDHDDRDFPSFPELNNYLDDLKIHYQNGSVLTDNDKAAICFAAGVSTHMNYDSNGSGTQVSYVDNALINKFGYDDADCVEWGSYNYIERLQDNMTHGRPVEFAIFTSGFNNGHAINGDGYNTDNFYHLNFGWGSSNSSCWYLLPTGMPNSYSIITDTILDIEGGDAPIEEVYGYVNMNGASPVGTYITLEGENFHECYVNDVNGTFQIPAVWEGTYQATAVLEEDRFYYAQTEVYLSEGTNFIQFDMGNFESLAGTVTAPISPENCQIRVYQDGELMSSGAADADGNFSIPSVLPGEYFATASLAGNYFDSQNVTITVDNQIIDFVLEEYPGDVAYTYSGYPAGIWNLVPNYTMSCAILLTEEELSGLEGDIFSKVRFKAPINPADGELYGQIWKGNDLVSEIEVEDFTAGEWVEVILETFAAVDITEQYYVGYKIHTLTGDLAYHDAGPRVAGKGAFMRTGGWTELAASLDYNFCIEAVIISQNFGTISGSVDLNEGNGNIIDVAVKADNYMSHPDADGNYVLYAKSGTYDLYASLLNYDPDQINGISLSNGDTLENQDFTLNYNVSADDEFTETSLTRLIGNYPNPFSSQTTISFNLTPESGENAEIEIYNIKGEKVRVLECFNSVETKATESLYSISWDGKDKEGRDVSAGVYLYKLKHGSRYSSTKKMILMK